MSQDLIIVESPTKARTLKQFLGDRFDTVASVGHIRDLPEDRLAVDVDNDFEPEYVVISRGRGKEIVTDLKRRVKGAASVILATDPDREGEAIAWHLAQVLGLKNPSRIVFHEITRRAVEEALKSPRPLDLNLVDAQQARRVVDRLVGYPLSHFLGRYVKKGLGGGRVQSVALRLVCEREEERERFQPREYWTLEADLTTPAGDLLKAAWFDPAATGSRKNELPDEAACDRIRAAVAGGVPFTVESVESTEKRQNPPQPYITSSLQQDASSRLRFNPKRTMRLAQDLYEGVELGSGQVEGLITYMRTDSTEISAEAFTAATGWLTAAFGAPYAAKSRTRAKSGKLAQEAHEAIRPTDPTRRPEDVEPYLKPDQAALYKLIWSRFMASCMTPAINDITTAIIAAGDQRFRASGSVLRFDGYLKIWERQDEAEKLPAVAVGENLSLVELRPEQHFTQPPPRYSEATLIKELEERGIGRPSTYATIVDKINQYEYVVEEKRYLAPTKLGREVNGVMVGKFPEVADPEFTAHLEEKLDLVQSGERPWRGTVADFYLVFHGREEIANEELKQTIGRPCPTCGNDSLKRKASRHGPFLACSTKECKYTEDLADLREETGEVCPLCGKALVKRRSQRGEFLGCSGYPECTYIKAADGLERREPEILEEMCPKCGKHPLAKKHGRRGEFVGCSGYPECDYIQGRDEAVPGEDLGSCPTCGKPLAKRMSRRGPFVGCTGYPDCRYIQKATGAAGGRPEPRKLGEKCPDCSKELLIRTGPRGDFIGCSGYPKCRYSRPLEQPAAPEAEPVTK